MGCHKSTVYREIKRNSVNTYDPNVAEKLATERFKACRKKKIIQGDIEKLILEKIKLDWSPEEISGRCLDENKLKVSPETIYKFIRTKKPQDFKAHLRRYKKSGAGRTKSRKYKPEWMKSIHDRPSEANHRQAYGHWERDTMYAKDRKLLVVCLERKSRLIKLEKVIEPFSLNLTNQTKDLLASTGKEVRSITNDNGSEFKDGWLFNVPVYYCDPHSPQQRGSVENAIGLIRQYIKRTTDLNALTPENIKEIEDRINLRPRKILDYKTPYEVFYGKTVALVS